MSRLVRMLSDDSTIHAFGRLRAVRGRLSCRDKGSVVARAVAPEQLRDARLTPQGGQPSNVTVLPMPAAALPRTAALRPAPASATPQVRANVRIYRRQSGMTMVGNIDAICRMIDRCIADEREAFANNAVSPLRQTA